VGCLSQDRSRKWLLTRAAEPVATDSQATSTLELSGAAASPLGTQTLDLLGVEVFHPHDHEGRKVAVKGVLIPNTANSRINVTSLQTLAASCD
jgi:hypothetical protein